MADLTPYARKKINDFAEAAKSWGYMEDQGSGPDVSVTYDAYDEAKNDLEQYVANLLKKAKKKA